MCNYPELSFFHDFVKISHSDGTCAHVWLEEEGEERVWEPLLPGAGSQSMLGEWRGGSEDLCCCQHTCQRPLEQFSTGFHTDFSLTARDNPVKQAGSTLFLHAYS